MSNDTTDAVMAFINALSDRIDEAKKEGRTVSAIEAATIALKSPMKDHIKSVSFSGTTKVKRKK
jgi:hypothetical protein